MVGSGSHRLLQSLTACEISSCSASSSSRRFMVITQPVSSRSQKSSCIRPCWAVICNFWHPGTLTLRAERQSARMSKITNDGSTRSGTGCFIAETTVVIKEITQRVNHQSIIRWRRRRWLNRGGTTDASRWRRRHWSRVLRLVTEHRVTCQRRTSRQRQRRLLWIYTNITMIKLQQQRLWKCRQLYNFATVNSVHFKLPAFSVSHVQISGLLLRLFFKFHLCRR